MSSVKLGLAVLWPAFWTALPIKLALVLLMLAMGMMHVEAKAGVAFLLLLASPVTVGAYPILTSALDVHVAEGVGLALLFLLSIPIDIWALGLVGRTVFLERLRVQPPDQLGLTLWWQSALIGALYLPLLWFVEGFVTDMARSIAHSILELELLKAVPVAERISAELTLWGSVSTAVLLGLLLLGLWLIGCFVVKKQAAKAAPAAETYQALIARWDLMRVPADQGLLLTAFTGTGVFIGVLFWASLPVTTPHPHESYKQPVVKVAPPFKPLDVLNKSEKVLTQAEATVDALEKKAEEDAQTKSKGGKDKAAGKDASAAKGAQASAPAKPAAAPAPAAAKAASPAPQSGKQ